MKNTPKDNSFDVMKRRAVSLRAVGGAQFPDLDLDNVGRQRMPAASVGAENAHLDQVRQQTIQKINSPGEVRLPSPMAVEPPLPPKAMAAPNLSFDSGPYKPPLNFDPRMPPQAPDLGLVPKEAPMAKPQAAPQLRLPNESGRINAAARQQAMDMEHFKANAARLEREARAAMHGDGTYGLPKNPPVGGAAAPAAAKAAPTTRMGKMMDAAGKAAQPALDQLGKAAPLAKGVAKTALRAAPWVEGAYETASNAADGNYGRAVLGGLATASLATPATAPLGLGYLGAKALTDMAMTVPYGRLDDQAREAMKPVPMPAKPAAAAAGQPEDFTAKNNAKLAKADEDWKKFNGPAELGATRRADREGNLLPEGQEMVYTGPKMGWQQRTSDAEKSKLAADNLKWRDDRDAVAEKLNAQTAATLARFAKQDEQNALMAAMDRPMGKHKRASLTQLMNTKAQNESSQMTSAARIAAEKENAQLQASTLRRGQDIDLQRVMAPIQLAQMNRKLMSDLAAHPSINGDPALMAQALLAQGRPDLAKDFSDQAGSMMTRAKASDDLVENKWKGMREMFAYSHPDKEGNPEVSKAVNDRAYASLRRTNPTAYNLNDRDRSIAVKNAIADEEIMTALRNPTDGGWASLVPQFLSGNEPTEQYNDIPDADFFRGAEVGPRVSGLRDILTPFDDKGDRFLKRPGNKQDPNLGKLSADAVARLQYYIDSANTTRK